VNKIETPEDLGPFHFLDSKYKRNEWAMFFFSGMGDKEEAFSY